MSSNHTVYLAVSSGQPDQIAYLRSAVNHLRQLVTIERVSSLYTLQRPGDEEASMWVSTVVAACTALRPLRLLRELQAIEQRMGRSKERLDLAMRIDIDILLYGRLYVESLDLEIPHPRLAERPVLLTSLVELEPRLVHPTLNYTVSEMLQDADEADMVRRYTVVSRK